MPTPTDQQRPPGEPKAPAERGTDRSTVRVRALTPYLFYQGTDRENAPGAPGLSYAPAVNLHLYFYELPYDDRIWYATTDADGKISAPRELSTDEGARAEPVGRKARKVVAVPRPGEPPAAPDRPAPPPDPRNSYTIAEGAEVRLYAYPCKLGAQWINANKRLFTPARVHRQTLGWDQGEEQTTFLLIPRRYVLTFVEPFPNVNPVPSERASGPDDNKRFLDKYVWLVIDRVVPGYSPLNHDDPGRDAVDDWGENEGGIGQGFVKEIAVYRRIEAPGPPLSDQYALTVKGRRWRLKFQHPPRFEREPQERQWLMWTNFWLADNGARQLPFREPNREDENDLYYCTFPLNLYPSRAEGTIFLEPWPRTLEYQPLGGDRARDDWAGQFRALLDALVEYAFRSGVAEGG